ncbi:hypothetical protein KO525_14930 [Psychrosphaera sp. B3R10]|uniref:hypothetical protein n=1 Tax=unclassified Psychrosphaera TaxID=2641570 RepID=UPI001C09BE55|nr:MULTISPECIES: hypothetical protein [unclassified Psychrosphaera]MBU2880596.1 hypothetical protein [Psychrosphaera sp. I2R16]MBU2990682.1 hypothetical protein [Psychrosphaera sp. B3R10]
MYGKLITNILIFVSLIFEVMATELPSSPQQDICKGSDDTVSSVKTESKENTNAPSPQCVNQSLPPPVENKTDKDITELEKELEEKRLKVLFVDVNTVMETVGDTMDWTANWVDGYFANGKPGSDKAKAWGHVVMGWEPRDGEWGNFPVKFKVRAKLPNLKDRVELILTDDEQDDFKNLPYESVRPDAYKSSERSLGAAIRFLHSVSEDISTSSRLGWGDNQLYARSQMSYRKKFFNDKVSLTLQPSLEYYVSDGWGSRFLIDTGLEVSPINELRLNYSIRDLQTYESPEWRSGLYSITAVSDKSVVIVGLSSVGVVKPKYAPEFYKFSVRYRRKAIRSWIFFEVEPFLEFSREPDVDSLVSKHGYTEFQRDIGITLRFEVHYGFL